MKRIHENSSERTTPLEEDLPEEFVESVMHSVSVQNRQDISKHKFPTQTNIRKNLGLIVKPKPKVFEHNSHSLTKSKNTSKSHRNPKSSEARLTKKLVSANYLPNSSDPYYPQKANLVVLEKI